MYNPYVLICFPLSQIVCFLGIIIRRIVNLERGVRVYDDFTEIIFPISVLNGFFNALLYGLFLKPRHRLVEDESGVSSSLNGS